MQCKYKKRDGSRCRREALHGSEKDYCILHEDCNYKNEEETKREFYREIEEGVMDFEGCILPEISLVEREFRGGLNFIDAAIKGGALFNEATIEGDALFEGVTIEGNASFDRATIRGSAWFEGATIKGGALFNEATIDGDASFEGATIKVALFVRVTIERNALFNGATIKGDAWFVEATIKGDAWFVEATMEGDALFNRATIERDASFDRATIERDVRFSFSNIGSLTFKNAKFNNMSGQEKACRTARRTQERIGDRVLADYHFYREMEAKRKQKYKTFSLKLILKLIRKLGLEKQLHEYIRFLEKERRIYWGFLELPIQYIFGYGVYPLRVIVTWLLTVFCLAFVYWVGNGVEAADSLVEYIYFSVVTAATPGYGGYYPKPGIYQLFASFEAIFGTFMWAAFIATFARKYMR